MKKRLSFLLIILMIVNQGLPVISYADEIISNTQLSIDEEVIKEEDTITDNNQEIEEVIKEEDTITDNNQEIEEVIKEEDTITDNNQQIEELIEKEVDKNDELVGSIYNTYKKVTPKIAINENEYVPEEYIKNIQELNNINYLETKTEENYEIVYSEGKNIYTYVNSVQTIDEAIKICENLEKSNNKIPTVINNNGIIVYSTDAMGRIIKHVNGQPYSKNDKNTNIYSTSSKKSAYTYINHGYIDDVPILENNGNMARIEVNGYTGWVNSDSTSSEFDIVSVPINQVTNPSYYISSNGKLLHFISTDITSTSQKGYSIILGPAPSFMTSGKKYYSYDGNYFYTTINELINDAKNNTHSSAINANNIYYGYYLYLPFRSKTNYTAAQINKYINNNTPSDSILRGAGQVIIDKQNEYGANAAIILGIAMNESAKGTSNIAKNKNNLFGINAVDSNTGNATVFNSVGDCIDQFAKYYISRGYSDPQDWRYRGGYLGTKKLGANVKYASDPFWGEKAARYYYELDNYLSNDLNDDLKDYNYYQLATYDKINEVRNSNRELLYNIKSNVSSNHGSVGNIIIISSKTLFYGDKYKWYQINPERNTESSKEFHGNYDWNDKGYVKTDGIKLINKSTKSEIGVAYNSYVEAHGWQGWMYDGQTSGLEGKNRRIEGISIKLTEAPKDMKIKYRAHVEDYGWQNWVYDGALAGTTDQWKRAEALQIELENAPEKYNVQYRVYVEGQGWQNWVSNGMIAGTTGQSKKIENIEIRIVQGDIQNQVPSIEYKTYIEGYGWQSERYDGETSGTTDQWKRIEGISIKLKNAPKGMKIKYRAHVEGYGWQNWVYDGALAGTTDQWKRAEAMQVELVGAPDDYNVQYRAYVEGYGWQDWVSNGEIAGTTGQYKRMEAIEIRIVKGKIEPENLNLVYQAYVEGYGWQDWKNEGELAGTVNKWSQIEGLQLKLVNAPDYINLNYQVYIEGEGWQDWRSNGHLAGTVDEWKKIEGIKIQLEGSKAFSVQYQAYIEGYGWQDWKSDGELAGIINDEKGIEGIQIKIIKNN